MGVYHVVLSDSLCAGVSHVREPKKKKKLKGNFQKKFQIKKNIKKGKYLLSLGVKHSLKIMLKISKSSNLKITINRSKLVGNRQTDIFLISLGHEDHISYPK